MALTIGQKVTLLKIDDMLAMSHRYELEVRDVLEPQATSCWTAGTFLSAQTPRARA
jgi:hypothetical protein